MRPRILPPIHHAPSPVGTKRPPHTDLTSSPPDIRNTTMPPHSGKGESDVRFYFKVFCLVTFVTCCGNICVFVLRCGACSSSGARVSHGSDCSHIDYGLRLALEEQVCILSSTCRGQKEKLSFKGFLFDDVHFLSIKGKRAPKEHMTSLTGIVQVWVFSAAQAYVYMAHVCWCN